MDFLEQQIRQRKLTKTELAERMSVSRRTLGNWWSDLSLLTTEEHLALLADALEVNEETRAVFYSYAGRAMPPHDDGTISPGDLRMHKQMINGISHPAVLITRFWDVLLTNRPFRELFASVPHYGRAVPWRNTMRYILFNPAAYALLGGTQEKLYDGWVMPSFAAFSAVKQQCPNDPRLLDIEEEVNRRPPLLCAYRSTADWISQHKDLHVNSELRPFVHPRLGPTGVQVLTEEHLGWQPVHVTRATFLFPSADEVQSVGEDR